MSLKDVVACKEAMWEEFIQDCAQRDEAAKHQPSDLPSNLEPPSRDKTSFIGTIGSIGSRGLVKGRTPTQKPPRASKGTPIGGDFRKERTLTVLDELRWTDSDMRKGYREKFEILFDRYEMRINRHCAKILGTTTIPCLSMGSHDSFDQWSWH